VQNISVLRRALGTAPSGASYIETVAKRGYRFSGEVHWVAAAPPPSAAAPEAIPIAPTFFVPDTVGPGCSGAVAVGARKCRVGFSQPRIDLQRVVRGGDGQPSCLRGRPASDHHGAKLVVAIRQTSICRSVRRIFPDGLLIPANHLFYIGLASLAHVISRPQVRFERVAVY
jgi:hypothetical protein